MVRPTRYFCQNHLFPRLRGGEAPSERRFTATWEARSSRRTPLQTARSKIGRMVHALKHSWILSTRRPACRTAQPAEEAARVHTLPPAASIRAASMYLWPTPRSDLLSTMSRRIYGGLLEHGHGTK